MPYNEANKSNLNPRAQIDLPSSKNRSLPRSEGWFPHHICASPHCRSTCREVTNIPTFCILEDFSFRKSENRVGLRPIRLIKLQREIVSIVTNHCPWYLAIVTSTGKNVYALKDSLEQHPSKVSAFLCFSAEQHSLCTIFSSLHEIPYNWCEGGG